MRKYYYSLTQPPKWILENERMTHKDTDFIFSFMKMTMFLSVKRDIVLWPNFRISQQIDKVSEENVLLSFINTLQGVLVHGRGHPEWAAQLPVQEFHFRFRVRWSVSRGPEGRSSMEGWSSLSHYPKFSLLTSYCPHLPSYPLSMSLIPVNWS